MRMPALFDAKDTGFFEIYGVSAWTRRGRVNFFAILCGRILWTAPYDSHRHYNSDRLVIQVISAWIG